MPPAAESPLLSAEIVLPFIKFSALIILVLYAIFALVVVRQVDLMSKTLITKVSPVLKALAIVNAGFAIGLIFLAWGIL